MTWVLDVSIEKSLYNLGFNYDVLYGRTLKKTWLKKEGTILDRDSFMHTFVNDTNSLEGEGERKGEGEGEKVRSVRLGGKRCS